MQRASLRIKPDGGAEVLAEIESEETLIGRSLNADVRLPDKGASRDHAMIMWESDHYEIEDLQTTNGTRVNGKKIRSATLANEDEIVIGRSRLVFLVDGE